MNNKKKRISYFAFRSMPYTYSYNVRNSIQGIRVRRGIHKLNLEEMCREWEQIQKLSRQIDLDFHRP